MRRCRRQHTLPPAPHPCLPDTGSRPSRPKVGHLELLGSSPGRASVRSRTEAPAATAGLSARRSPSFRRRVQLFALVETPLLTVALSPAAACRAAQTIWASLHGICLLGRSGKLTVIEAEAGAGAGRGSADALSGRAARGVSQRLPKGLGQRSTAEARDAGRPAIR